MKQTDGSGLLPSIKTNFLNFVWGYILFDLMSLFRSSLSPVASILTMAMHVYEF